MAFRSLCLAWARARRSAGIIISLVLPFFSFFMTTANDVDFEELLTRFDRVTKTLADAPLDQHLGEAKDIARQIQVTLDAKTEASSENLAGTLRFLLSTVTINFLLSFFF